jgi:hypothetical protein
MGIRKVSAKEARGLKGTTDWKELKRLTDEEIKSAAMIDPDAQEIGPFELTHFRRGENT